MEVVVMPKCPWRLALFLAFLALGSHGRAAPCPVKPPRAVTATTEKHLYAHLAKHGTVVFPSGRYSLRVKAVRGRKLLGLVLRRTDVNGRFQVEVQAREAELCIGGKKRLFLHLSRGQAFCADGTRAFFEDRVWELPLRD
jgi:hypothetical protein